MISAEGMSSTQVLTLNVALTVVPVGSVVAVEPSAFSHFHESVPLLVCQPAELGSVISSPY